MDLELVIRGGEVVDGTGRPRFRADLGIREGRVAAVSPGQALNGAEVIDAAGYAVAPGFIDVHSHASGSCPWRSIPGSWRRFSSRGSPPW